MLTLDEGFWAPNVRSGLTPLYIAKVTEIGLHISLSTIVY